MVSGWRECRSVRGGWGSVVGRGLLPPPSLSLRGSQARQLMFILPSKSSEICLLAD
jgi:hypothetical protein